MNDFSHPIKIKGIKQWVRDASYGGALMLISIGNMIYARTLPPGSINIKSAQAGTYLMLVMVLLCALGICLLVRAFIQKPEKICDPLFNTATVITIVAMAIYIFLMNKIGFILSSFLFIFLLTAYYSGVQDIERIKGQQKIKNLGKYALFAIIITGACYYLFGTVLSVVLPQFTLF